MGATSVLKVGEALPDPVGWRQLEAVRATTTTPNSQLPTPNALGSNRLGKSRDNRASCNVFHPDGSNRSPWELGVGGCELTCRRHRVRLQLPICHPEGPLDRLEIHLLDIAD